MQSVFHTTFPVDWSRYEKHFTVKIIFIKVVSCKPVYAYIGELSTRAIKHFICFASSDHLFMSFLSLEMKRSLTLLSLFSFLLFSEFDFFNMLDYGFICKNTKLSKHAPLPSKKMLNWEQIILYALYVLIRLFKKVFVVLRLQKNWNTHLTLIEKKKCPSSIKRTKGTLYAEECAIMTSHVILRKGEFLIFFSFAKTDISKLRFFLFFYPNFGGFYHKGFPSKEKFEDEQD